MKSIIKTKYLSWINTFIIIVIRLVQLLLGYININYLSKQEIKICHNYKSNLRNKTLANDLNLSIRRNAGLKKSIPDEIKKIPNLPLMTINKIQLKSNDFNSFLLRVWFCFSIILWVVFRYFHRQNNSQNVMKWNNIKAGIDILTMDDGNNWCTLTLNGNCLSKIMY